MTKKFHKLLIILTLGFFATPTLTYACGTSSTKAENSCCKKEKEEKSNKKDCCKKHKSKKDIGCDGKCNNSTCNCTTIPFAFNLPFTTTFNVKINIAESKKLKFYHNETYLSSGFYSIWTPPNIG